MTISVCIATVRPTTLGFAIASILRQTWTDWELIIVGQGPDAPLAAAVNDIAGHDHRVTYLHLNEMGLSRARNAGIRAGIGDVIAMTDDDCEAHPEWLAMLADAFCRMPGVDLVGGSVISPQPHHGRFAYCPSLAPTDALYDPTAMNRRAPRGWDWIGANFALRRDVIDRVGLFDEYLGAGAIFPAGEDTDYKLRLEVRGTKMLSTPRAIVNHTFGWRYGLRQRLHIQRNYALGNGALAAKLTLSGDRRGQEWLREEIRSSVTNRLDWSRHRPGLPNAMRLWYCMRGYQQCLNGYEVDPSAGVLRPRADGRHG